MNAIRPRKMVNLQSFLKEAASAGSGIKYIAVKTETHRFYVPVMKTVVDNQEVTAPFAEMHNIHEWKEGDKFHSVECVADFFGTCPCCDRVNDAWSIYNFRIDQTKEQLKAQGMDDAAINYRIKGEQDKEKRRQPNAYKGISATFVDELKMKAPKPYLYLLVAQFETDPSGTNPVLENGMPKYNLKVMKLTQGRVESLAELFNNAGGVVEGNEFTIKYGNYEDRAELVGQSNMAPVFTQFCWITIYPGLKDKIDQEAAQFDLTSISKSFDELKELEEPAIKNLANSGFARWDAYQAEKTMNPNAVYLEYSSTVQAAPQIGAPQSAQGMTFALPGQGAQGQPGMMNGGQPNMMTNGQVNMTGQPGMMNGTMQTGQPNGGQPNGGQPNGGQVNMNAQGTMQGTAGQPGMNTQGTAGQPNMNAQGTMQFTGQPNGQPTGAPTGQPTGAPTGAPDPNAQAAQGQPNAQGQAAQGQPNVFQQGVPMQLTI